MSFLFFRGKGAAASSRRGSADEARSHHQNSFATKLRQKPFLLRMGFVYCGSFAFGAVIEYFACKTGLYETVASKKADRRLEIDEFVADFRTNLEKWQEEDKQRALQYKQRAAAPTSSSST